MNKAKTLVSENLTDKDNLLYQTPTQTKPLSSNSLRQKLNELHYSTIDNPDYSKPGLAVFKDSGHGSSKLEWINETLTKLVNSDTSYGTAINVSSTETHYRFCSFNQSNVGNRKGNTVKPKLLIFGGMDGTAYESVITMVQIFREIFKNWRNDAWCAKVYNSLDIEFIPFVNTHGLKQGIQRNDAGFLLTKGYVEDRRENLDFDTFSDQKECIMLDEWVDRSWSKNIGIIQLLDHADPKTMVSASSYHPRHAEIARRTMEDVSDWAYSSNLADRVVSPAGEPMIGVKWVGMVDSGGGSFNRHMAVTRSQPCIDLYHPNKDHPFLKTSPYWSRFLYRIAIRNAINRLIDDHRDNGYYFRNYGG